MRVNYAIVFVSNMEKSTAFYRDLLGLPLKFSSPHWTEFLTEGATLALHQSEVPASLEDADKVPPGRCRPGFSVVNLDEFHQKMLANQVRVVQEPKMVFGTKLAQYIDPDGLGLSVSEAK